MLVLKNRQKSFNFVKITFNLKKKHVLIVSKIKLNEAFGVIFQIKSIDLKLKKIKINLRNMLHDFLEQILYSQPYHLIF